MLPLRSAKMLSTTKIIAKIYYYAFLHRLIQLAELTQVKPVKG